jgi:hypothetical protein
MNATAPRKDPGPTEELEPELGKSCRMVRPAQSILEYRAMEKLILQRLHVQNVKGILL